MKSKKGLFLIILSVLIGAGTFLGIQRYVYKLEEKVPVVIAKDNILAFTEITEDLIEVKDVSTINLPEGYAPKSELVIGMYTGSLGIHKAEFISRDKVFKEDEIKDNLLKNKIEKGNVAVAIDVDIITSVGGTIKENDYVDISVVNDDFNVTPVEGIKVIGVKDKDSTDIEKSKEENPLPYVVIFEATPDERDVVVKISKLGKPHLSLRNPEDSKEVKINHDAIKQLEEKQKESEEVNTNF